MFIDTHTHLFSDQFKEDVDEVIEKAISRGVKRFYLPNVDTNSVERMNYLADRYPDNCFPMIGLHPCSVKENFEEELKILKKELDSERTFFGIGEIGLDYHWDLTFKDQQKEALKVQIQWAKETKLPIILHTRESFDDTLEIVQSLNDENLSGIFHCFTGSVEEANKVFELENFYVGIGGVITFKNSGLDKIVAQLPMDKVLLETDSPYLAPTPYRGKRNESTYIPEIAAKVAEAQNLTLEMVAKTTSENALKLFG